MSEIGAVGASERVVTVEATLAPIAGRRSATRRDRRAAEHDDVLTVYRAHHAELVRFATFVAPEDGMAEDLVQDAFVKLYGAWRRIDDPARVGGYLRTTVLNLARGRARHLGVVRRNRPDPRPEMASAESGALRNDDRDRVVAALRRLSERQRACLVLRHYEDRSESEIAEILGISIGSVRTHVHRGMEGLGRPVDVVDQPDNPPDPSGPGHSPPGIVDASAEVSTTTVAPVTGDPSHLAGDTPTTTPPPVVIVTTTLPPATTSAAPTPTTSAAPTTTTVPVELTASARFGSCEEDPPYDEYSGFAAPGVTVTLTSPWSAPVNVIAAGDGSWFVRIEFPTAPVGEHFTVTASDETTTVDLDFVRNA